MAELSRVKYDGMVYIAKAVFTGGFVTLSGQRVMTVDHKNLGPVFCQACCIKHATILRKNEDTVFRPRDQTGVTTVTLTRLICESCNKLEKLPLKCKCGSPAVLSVGGKIIHKGTEYWFRDQVCEACHEAWDERREQFLREALVLVRPITLSGN